MSLPVSFPGLKTNGHTPVLRRADEVDDLVDAVKALIVPYIRAADEAAPHKLTGGGAYGTPANVLVDRMEPAALAERMSFALPLGEGAGREGLLDLVRGLLRYSVNTWDQGYLDKLCASTDAVGVVAEMLLAVLNTNSHVYQVSPALTVVEKTTARTFASLFGLVGPRAGGITCQGGSASNFTSLVSARGALYPDTRSEGNGSYRFAVFTSCQGHYSIQKAALACGMGVSSVVAVESHPDGRMDVDALRASVLQAKADGRTPLYVNATAGTTVFGAFDPLPEIAAVCAEFNMWFHVDASWGGAAIFSHKHKHKLAGSHLADSLTINPHKMLNVPATCSFLLTRDTALLHRANTLPAGYLFHNDAPGDDVWDMADLTLQCGRRADSVKLALSWTYYGAAGFRRAADNAFSTAAHLASVVEAHPDFCLVSSNPPPCLQVCFYYAPGGRMGKSKEENTRRTKDLVKKIAARGFMIDYAPGDAGSFFRVAVNWQTLTDTVEGIIVALEQLGKESVIV
ncbi:pyridoxal phosphate-dependent transferase [Ilyonectria robusta]|uniref:pyridoxal phosphate-dependent transferase n=1 Tax=Ilyonectria robusta TaxID=1079257 RepID=UPI001E8CB0CD|nr:pyridoxal phosphate-dependent transferase [Ilyonectria robusta]KAH8736620.1 pyridoxal phosphate-dependent transferase [Ilyonectria robusta]